MLGNYRVYGVLRMSAIIDNNAIQAIFAQPTPEGAFEGDYLTYLRGVGARRSVLFLAFAPKAAGTFFRQVAMHAVNGDLFRTSHAQGGRDGLPYLPNLLAYYLDKDLPEIVVHIHMQAFAANRHLLSAFGIRPVIMLRNIPDMLASFWDMLETDPVARAQCLNCVVPDNFVEMSRAQKADFMLDIIFPWYASYFASWKSFVDEAPAQVCVLRYRNFCQDPATSIHMALAHSGFAASRNTCTAALERVWPDRSNLRYNKGTEGRGKSYFAASQLAEIARKLSHYPQLDAWMPDLMGAAMELVASPRISLAAS
jgi:hypothetical protein